MTRKEHWVRWLEGYGPDKFYDQFVRNAQGAKSRCRQCGAAIYLDIVEGGGVADWRTRDGDYGCDRSHESNDEGCGSHAPEVLDLD